MVPSDANPCCLRPLQGGDSIQTVPLHFQHSLANSYVDSCPPPGLDMFPYRLRDVCHDNVDTDSVTSPTQLQLE